MKRPDELREALRRQWQNGRTREQRLLGQDGWPLSLAIAKPKPSELIGNLAAVRDHIARWRSERLGEVRWEAVRYRGAAAPVEIPIAWVLASPRQWVEAMADAGIRREFALLSRVLDASDPRFHPLLVRQRQQLLARSAEETIRACAVALELAPGCARGRPLRALSIAGNDSKFFERNRSLLAKLLEVRFGPAALERGLESFLDAQDEGEHWLLVAPLTPGLLPFAQLRLRSSELSRAELPGSHILIVENERSLYQLPKLSGTIAILGAGLNLGWMQAGWLTGRTVGYWGDIDTWGLGLLAQARAHQPGLTALLMTAAIFDEFAERFAVPEPVTAGQAVPRDLSGEEQALYRRLLETPRGRLEQELLPLERVHGALSEWRGKRGEPDHS